jgi:predicted DNA-binding transcriptional regulator YafY
VASTSSRTLRLLTLLQAQRHWAGPDLADALGVSARTLRRDVDRLRELGYPVRASRGTDGGYQLAAGASLPPLALDDDEAVALAIGLQAGTTSTVGPVAEPSLRALAKVVQVMPPRLRRQVEALRGATDSGSWTTGGGDDPDPAVLLTAARACRDAETLELDYTAVDGARTQRRVEPHRLVSLGRRWYLVSYDLERHDWRSFRADRVGAVRATGRRFRPRALPVPDAAEFVRRSITGAPRNHDVRAVLHCPAATAQDRLGRWAQLRELGPDRCELTLRTESLDWAVFALGSAGAEVSEVAPAELVERLREWSGRFDRAVSPR